jgi:hypothetical protein
LKNSLGFDTGLIWQHDRDIVTDRKDPMARGTFQTAPITSQIDTHFANWADKNIK